MKALLARLFAASFLLAASGPASVLYTFNGSGFGGGQAFALSTPDFVTMDTTFAASALQACNIQGDSCRSVALLPSGPADSANHPEIDITAAVSGNTASFFFPYDAFSTAGVYRSVYPFNPATLVVTSIPAAIPEPASFGLVSVVLLVAALSRARLPHCQHR